MNNVKNIVKFGQNLHLMIEQLKKDNIGNEENEIALRVHYFDIVLCF